MRKVLLVSFAAVVVASCATFDPGRWVSDALFPVSEEVKLGKEIAAQVEKEAKLHKNDDVQDYVAGVGKKIVRKVKDVPKGIKFTFKVIDDDKTVNAFALPGGHIYVYSGLLKVGGDEAELAAVLGHEIAHVTQRHVAERLIAANGIDAVMGMALGKNPGLVGQIAQSVLGGGAILKFTRDQESDADEHGVPYSASAGYDPFGFVRFFKKLQEGEGPGFLEIMQSHPLPTSRIKDVKAIIAKMKNKPDDRNKAAYKAMQKKL